MLHGILRKKETLQLPAKMPVKKDMEISCITYGSSSYDANRFKTPVRGNLGHKCKGGLWGCPVNSTHSWRKFCESEGFRLESLKKSFKWTFRGSLYVIESEVDAMLLPQSEPFYSFVEIDWDELPSVADGVWLTAEGEQATRYSLKHSLYGWDCETILAMNPDSIFPD